MGEKLLVDVWVADLSPTINHLWKSRKFGAKLYKSPEGKAWQDMCALILRNAAELQEPYTGNVRAEYTFQSKSRRKWDVDNRVKASQDCLAMAGIILDDKQIIKFSAERTQGPADATRIVVYAIEGECP